MFLDKLEKGGNILQSLITVAAICFTGLWAVYTYFLSDEAKHNQKIREHSFSIEPSISLKPKTLYTSENSHVVVEVTVKNNSLKTILLERYSEHDELVYFSKPLFTDSGLSLSRPIYAYEGYAPSLDGITEVLPDIEIEAAERVVINFISPPLEDGFYQVGFIGKLKVDGKTIKDLLLEKTSHIVINSTCKPLKQDK